MLGGHGNSGTAKSGLGQPRIDGYANTDGWFDDTSDGPVMARLVMFSKGTSAGESVTSMLNTRLGC